MQYFPSQFLHRFSDLNSCSCVVAALCIVVSIVGVLAAMARLRLEVIPQQLRQSSDSEVVVHG